MIEEVIPFKWEAVDELEETDRGVGGFGSTGEKTKT
jgi:dUTPase